MKINKITLRQFSLLVGTTIGAGIFALPYSFARLGLSWGLLAFCLALICVLGINSLYALIIVKTNGGRHELVGFSHLYLGDFGKLLSIVLLAVLADSALLAYSVLGGKFLGILLGKEELFFTLGIYYLIVLAVLILAGVKFLSKIDVFLVLSTIAIIAYLSLGGLPYWHVSNILSLSPISFNLKVLIESFGIDLFALSGFMIIPEMMSLGRTKKSSFKMVWLATLFVAVIYLVFVFTVVGLSGNKTSADALSGLWNTLPQPMIKLMYLLGIFTSGSAFLGLGSVLFNSYQEDLKISRSWAWFLVIYPPLFFYLFGQPTFAAVVGYSGFVSTFFLVFILALIFVKIKGITPSFIKRMFRMTI